jgi:S-DNA-T family DNA segregation ATPase FtsK/SpoIIIE
MKNTSDRAARSAGQGAAAEPAPTSQLENTLTFFLRFERFAWDLGGVLVTTLALLTLLALAGWTEGALISPWAAFLRRWLGQGSWLAALAGGLLGLRMLRRRAGDLPPVRWRRVFALEAAGFSLVTLLALLGRGSLERAEAGQDGGLIGWGLAELVSLFLPPAASIPIVGIILAAALLVGLGIWDWLGRTALRALERAAGEADDGLEPLAGGNSESLVIGGTGVSGAGGGAARRKAGSQLPAEFRKKLKLQEHDDRPAAPLPRNERLPSLDLLVDERTVRPDERNINQTAGLIEKTLAEFGIPARVIGFQVGPTVTQFAVEPGFLEKPGSEEEQIRQKVRVAQIASLSRDLSLALSAERLRIEAPVPGRPYIGIEVPNDRSSVVRLRPVLETETFQKLDSPLALALGRDVSGRAVVADLAKMPHLLIAGTTGSGKSVCIAAFTACLVMNNTPEDLRLVMIDPKMVELVRFNGLPHLYGRVETDLERIMGVLRWTVAEMDRRYRLLEESRSRHIESHNKKMARRKGGQVLPRIVVLIDELADLMMAAPDQTEPSLVRLAQLARATGIHLVVATQRPSTDVVTGLIKANFPARLSFAVTSGIDSRVILDMQGADTLLGKGDMLFLPPDAAGPIRAQGVMVTDQEVERVIEFWQGQHPQSASEAPPWEALLAQDEALADRDNLVAQAIEVVRATGRASTSLLQRRLKIGYPRAARLMDELEELGVVGPSLSGGREREVLPGPADDGQD